jgi:hypothetical protein
MLRSEFVSHKWIMTTSDRESESVLIGRLVFTDERLRLLVGATNGQTGVIPGQKSAWGKFGAADF